MSVNSLSFEQAASLLNAIRKQATGADPVSMVNSSDFVSVATVTLANGVDPILNSISQLIGRTIFSVRPYSRKFAGLYMDAQRFGYITRKLQVADKDFSNSSRFALVDGQSVDHWVVSKANVLSTQFYGQNVFEKQAPTVYKDQLDVAFSSPEELSRFYVMQLQNTLDMIEQSKETVTRMTIANMIGGKIAAANGIVHCLTEYNTETGITPALTNVTVFDPANFGEFCKWLFARMENVSNMMTERSELYQINVTGKVINHHTPKDRQKAYILSKFLGEMKARVTSGAFNKSFLEFSDVEEVNYWQGINTPDAINVTPVYMKTDGTLETAANPVSQAGILGIMFDEEALGVNVFNEYVLTTPMNAKGAYSNSFYHFTQRYFNDYCEKFICFILD